MHCAPSVNSTVRDAVTKMQDRHPRANVTRDFSETFAERGRHVRKGISRPAVDKLDHRLPLTIPTRAMLTHRKLLQSKAIDNDLLGTLRNFGLKVGVVGACREPARPGYAG